MTQVLATRIRVRDDEDVVHTYEAGDKPPKAHADLITNPDAWVDDKATENANAAAPGGFFDDVTRQQMLDAAEDLGAEVPKSAPKEVIAGAIKAKLFENKYAPSDDEDDSDDSGGEPGPEA